MNIPDYMHGAVQDTINCQRQEVERRSLWSTILGLIPVKDGNQWCVLYGENLQEGIAAFGKTPEDAMYKFELEFQKP